MYTFFVSVLIPTTSISNNTFVVAKVVFIFRLSNIGDYLLWLIHINKGLLTYPHQIFMWGYQSINVYVHCIYIGKSREKSESKRMIGGTTSTKKTNKTEHPPRLCRVTIHKIWAGFLNLVFVCWGMGGLNSKTGIMQKHPSGFLQIETTISISVFWNENLRVEII